MNWKLWLEGLAAAIAGGAATTLTSGNVSPENYKALGTAAAINGAICGILYVTRSPKDRRQGNEERRRK